MSCHEIKDGQDTVRLIKIRNPWGEQEWKGKWSDGADNWTQETMDQVNFECKDDGVFFIQFEDYLRFFYMTTVCKYVEGGDLSVCEDEHSKNPNARYCLQSFTIPKEIRSPVIITLNQIHQRFMKQDGKLYEYAPFKFILAKVVEEREVCPHL